MLSPSPFIFTTSGADVVLGFFFFCISALINISSILSTFGISGSFRSKQVGFKKVNSDD